MSKLNFEDFLMPILSDKPAKLKLKLGKEETGESLDVLAAKNKSISIAVG